MLGELAALFTAVMWSGTSIAFSEASLRIGALQLNINRLFMATIFLALTILIGQIAYELNSEQIIYLAISGVVGFIFGDSFLFRCFKEIGPRLGMLLMSLVPAIAAILAFVFLGEVLAWLHILAMVVTISGIVMVILERKPTHPKFKFTRIGVFYGVLGALGQAVGLILAKAAFEIGDINGFVATFVRVVSAFVIFLPLGLITRIYSNPVPVFRKDPKALLFMAIGSFTGPFLGVTGSLIAIANTQIGIASTIMALPPILMLPLVKVIYKEKLSYKAIGGAFIAVAGIALLFVA
jgi:drug/metabolite transporter (DMT)-like permease